MTFIRMCLLAGAAALAAPVMTVCAQDALAGDEGRGDVETVAYLVYGLEDGGEMSFPNGMKAGIHAVGRELTSNDPFGWELKYPETGSSVIYVEPVDGCRYRLNVDTYQTDRQLWTNAEPRRVKIELDFRQATWVGLIVGRVGERKTKFEGVTCTPLVNGEGLCKALTVDGMVTAASPEKYDGVLQHFKQAYCRF